MSEILISRIFPKTNFHLKATLKNHLQIPKIIRINLKLFFFFSVKTGLQGKHKKKKKIHGNVKADRIIRSEKKKKILKAVVLVMLTFIFVDGFFILFSWYVISYLKGPKCVFTRTLLIFFECMFDIKRKIN